MHILSYGKCKVCEYVEEKNECIHRYMYENATCTEDLKCELCGEIKEKALGHNYAKATCTEPSKCKRCDATTGSSLGHAYKFEQNDSETHKGICSRCDESTELDHIFKAGECRICGYVEEKNECIHRYMYENATCTEDLKCELCGEIKEKATGHKYEYKQYDSEKHERICEGCRKSEKLMHILKDGKCKVCGYVEEKNECIHRYMYENATCTEDLKCELCGEVKEKAKGHNYEYKQYDSEKHERICRDCEESEKVIHLFEDYKCQDCGYEKIKVLQNAIVEFSKKLAGTKENSYKIFDYLKEKITNGIKNMTEGVEKLEKAIDQLPKKIVVYNGQKIPIEQDLLESIWLKSKSKEIKLENGSIKFNGEGKKEISGEISVGIIGLQNELRTIQVTVYDKRFNIFENKSYNNNESDKDKSVVFIGSSDTDQRKINNYYTNWWKAILYNTGYINNNRINAINIINTTYADVKDANVIEGFSAGGAPALALAQEFLNNGDHLDKVILHDAAFGYNYYNLTDKGNGLKEQAEKNTDTIKDLLANGTDVILTFTSDGMIHFKNENGVKTKEENLDDYLKLLVEGNTKGKLIIYYFGVGHEDVVKKYYEVPENVANDMKPFISINELKEDKNNGKPYIVSNNENVNVES